MGRFGLRIFHRTLTLYRLSTSEASREFDSRANFYFAYSSLVLYSFGLENALERAKMDISFFLTNVYEAATVRDAIRCASIELTSAG